MTQDDKDRTDETIDSLGNSIKELIKDKHHELFYSIEKGITDVVGLPQHTGQEVIIVVVAPKGALQHIRERIEPLTHILNTHSLND